MYNFKGIPPSEQTKRDKRLVIVGIFLSVMAVTFPFVGCANPNIGQELEYVEDGHIYYEKVGTEKRMIRKITDRSE